MDFPTHDKDYDANSEIKDFLGCYLRGHGSHVAFSPQKSAAVAG